MPDLDHLTYEELTSGFLEAALACGSAENNGHPCDLDDLHELLCSGLELMRRRKSDWHDRILRWRDKPDYHTALTRILKWARDNSIKNTYDDGSVTRLFLRRSFDLFQILSDAGFEIDSNDDLVIHGERVRE